ESTALVHARVVAARYRAVARGVHANAELAGPDLDRWAPLSSEAHDLLATVLRSGRLSARGLARVRRVALTLADLAGHEGALTTGQVATALQLRADVSGLRGMAA
ncbi:MAG: ATP-binding protein, partial [Aquihabitans sp.]